MPAVGGFATLRGNRFGRFWPVWLNSTGLLMVCADAVATG
jgi:hypothetical protein